MNRRIPSILLLGGIGLTWAAPAYAWVSYVNKKGTRVFVDSESEIPPEYRPKPKPVPVEEPEVNPETVQIAVSTIPKPAGDEVATPPDVAKADVGPAYPPVVLKVKDNTMDASRMERRESIVKIATMAQDGFTKEWANRNLSGIDKADADRKKFFAKEMPECFGQKSLSDCFSKWLAANPPKIAMEIVGHLSLIQSVAANDHRAKSIGPVEFRLIVTEKTLDSLDAFNPENHPMLPIETNGMVEAAVKLMLKKSENDLLNITQVRTVELLRKQIAAFAEKDLAKASESEKSRYEAIKKRVDLLEKRDLTI